MRFLLALVALGLLAAAVRADAAPRVRVVDGRLVTADGKPAVLRGVNLGNWLLFEPGALGGAFGRFGDQANLFAVLRDRFGEAERRRLIDLYRDNYITARDFDNVARFGLNYVRVGFDHELLEDVGRPWELRPDAFKYLDYAVREAKARGLYVLFDLHGAQGRQVAGKQSGESGRADFWTVPDNQARSLWLWAVVVQHFHGDPTVLGYEMLNEPFGATEAQLLDYAQRWYARVRPIDADAVLVFPGLRSTGVAAYGNPADHGWTNCMFDLHFYPGVRFAADAKPSTIESASKTLRDEWPDLAERLAAIKTPLMVGELSIVYKSGGGGEMLRRYYDAATAYGWAVSKWTLKELSPTGGVKQAMWMLTTNAGPIPPVDFHTSTKGQIEQALLGLGTMPLVADDDTLHWLTTPDRPSELPPPAATAPATQP